MMNVAAIQSERERERQREIDQTEARHATARTNKPYIYTHTYPPFTSSRHPDIIFGPLTGE
jgi:hypothetical protein